MASNTALRAPPGPPADRPTAFLDWLPDAALVLDNDGCIAAHNRDCTSLFAASALTIGCSLAEVAPHIAAGLNLPYFRRDTSTREFQVDAAGQVLSLALQPFYDGERHLLVVVDAADGDRFTATA